MFCNLYKNRIYLTGGNCSNGVCGVLEDERRDEKKQRKPEQNKKKKRNVTNDKGREHNINKNPTAIQTDTEKGVFLYRRVAYSQ